MAKRRPTMAKPGGPIRIDRMACLRPQGVAGHFDGYCQLPAGHKGECDEQPGSHYKSVGFAVQPYVLTPTNRGAEWDLSGTATLVKPCGCRVDLVAQQPLDQHHSACQFCNVATEVLRTRVRKMCEENGEFTKYYRRRWHAKEACETYSSLLELIDRQEREEGTGPYSPLTLEVMNELAQEQRKEWQVGDPCKGCGMELASSDEHGVYCPGCLDGMQHIVDECTCDLCNSKQMHLHDKAIAQVIALPAPMPIMHKAPEKSYEIVVEDGQYGHRSREEMITEIATERTARAFKRLQTGKK